MKTRKLFAILLAVVLTFSLGVSALAAYGEGNKTITVKNVTDDTELAIYQILTYTLNADTGVSDITFVDNGYQGVFIAAINAYAGSVVLPDTASVTDIMLYITNELPNDSIFAKELAEALETYVDVNNIDAYATTSDGTKNADTTQIVFSAVEDGYYLILDVTEYDDLEYSSSDAIVMLQPSNADGIVVVLKSDYQKIITKTADDASYFIGSDVTFTITATIPATNNEEFVSYILTDTMSAGLSYNGNAKISVNETELTDISGIINVGTGGVNTFTFTAAAGYKIGDKIEIVYTAEVTDDATFENIVNELSHDWDEDTITVEVETYGFDFTKVDGDDNTITLAGVVFNVYAGEAPEFDANGDQINTTVSTLMTFKERITDATGDYIYDADGDAALVTGANGYLKAWGLKAGTYWLVEVDTLDGYNLEPTPREIELDDTLENDNNIYEYGIITNTTGIILPGTGGIGTTLFTILGSVTVLSAGLFLALNKKRVFGK